MPETIETTETKSWRLYVKWPGQSRFQAVNWKDGTQVDTLIRASIFTSSEKVQVEADLRESAADNEGMTWEFRPVNG